MRQRQHVEFVEARQHWVTVPVPDHFRFSARGPGAWLQRLAWRFLQWQRALAPATQDLCKITRHVIDTDDLMKRLLQQRAAMFDMVQEPKVLLIGSEDLRDLLGSPTALQQQHNFIAEYCVPRDGRRRLCGLEVRVIPWMRGMLVMP